MNDYKISYTTSRDERFFEIITERSEAAARKSFNAFNRGKGFTITKVDLHRENTSATKQQERDTLEAIRKMVEELGPQSYVATAFEGCFEDAESNIENDFGDSMKARWLHADAQLNAANGTIEELKEQLSESQKDYEAAHAAAHAIADQKDAEIAVLRRQVLSANDLTDCRQLADGYAAKLRDKIKAAEATILEYAEQPETTTFRDAVKERKALAKDIEYYTALAERISAIEVTD